MGRVEPGLPPPDLRGAGTGGDEVPSEFSDPAVERGGLGLAGRG